MEFQSSKIVKSDDNKQSITKNANHVKATFFLPHSLNFHTHILATIIGILKTTIELLMRDGRGLLRSAGL